METLLHVNYLNRVTILVNLENQKDYMLHLKIGKNIERRTYKEIDGNEKERLIAYLIAVERYHLWQEVIEKKRSLDEVRKEESYIQLVNFIGGMAPGYLFRWAYVTELKTMKESTRWISTYQGVPLVYNQPQSPQIIFRLFHEFDQSSKEVKQTVEWVVRREDLTLNSPGMNEMLKYIEEETLVHFNQAVNPTIPGMFDGFEELIDD